MRLTKIQNKVVAALIAAALIVPTVATVRNANAAQTQVPYAVSDSGEAHEHSFDLARVSDDDALSSYEEDNGKHWVKLFSKFDGEKNIFDDEQLPDDTAKVKVVFDVTNYDLDKAYPLTWATGIGGWASGKPTGVTIDQSGTYEAVLDFASETDGIGRTISGADISAASIQLVFQLGEGKQENIANTKKIHVNFKACYAYEASDEVKADPVIPIIDETPTPAPTAPQATAKPNNTATPAPTATAKTKKPVVKTNKVKKIKAAKKTVVIKKGKTKKVTFRITTAVAGKKTTDKLTKVSLSDKKIAKVTKKSLSKKTCTIKVKATKKGKTVLKIKIGKKQAKVKIKIV